MHAHDNPHRTDKGRGDDEKAKARKGPCATDLTALQRTVGNAAVARLIARSSGAHAEQDVQRSSVPDVLASSGRPLDGPVRGEMEARLGADFSDVRVHTGQDAQRSAAEIGARAYTSGNHVVIGEGGADQHTLAHELTHVIQQRSGPVAGTDNGTGLRVSDPADQFERAAEANATKALAGPVPEASTAPRHVGDPGTEAVQRMEEESAAEAPRARRLTGRSAALMHAHDEPGRASRSPQAGRLSAAAMLGLRGTIGNAATARLVTTVQAAPAEQEDLKRKRDDDEFPDDDLSEYLERNAAMIEHNSFVERLAAKLKEAGWAISSGGEGGWKDFTARLPKSLDDGRQEWQSSEPRSFRGQEERQALRWVSTVVKLYLENERKNPVEVQAAVDGGVFFLATNNDACNKRLSDLVAGKKGDMRALLVEMIASNKPDRLETLSKFDTDAKSGGRSTRLHSHHRQASEMLKADGGPQAKVVEALGGRVRVAPRGPEGTHGLHAERRILELNDGKMPEFIAGTRRPCISCYLEMYAGVPHIRPGVFYASRASNVGIAEYQRLDADAMAAKILASGVIATYDTVVWNHHKSMKTTTEEYDTDSEPEN